MVIKKLIIRKHIWPTLQAALSILYLVKYFRDPIAEGVLGPDDLILYFIAGGVVTTISIIFYLVRLSRQAIIPFAILILTIAAAKIGGEIKYKIRTNKISNVYETESWQRLTLFKDSTFEHVNHRVEFTHYDRGKYSLVGKMIKFDTTIYYENFEKTKLAYIKDSMIFFLHIKEEKTDTIKYYNKR